MAIAAKRVLAPRAVIFDLDSVLIDSRAAWCYALEEAVAAISGRRIDAGPLVAEYRRRPWAHAAAVIVDEPAQRERCAQLADEMFRRSALKRLLVHEGIGMALDALRGDQVEMGAISREPHPLALRQVESTGLERFLTVLSATPAEARFNPAARAGDCVRFLGYAGEDCAFVGADGAEAALVEAEGLRCFGARWATEADTGLRGVAAPGELRQALPAAWR
ncbi:MAG: HAD family hydrolase [Tepidiformaceae bacterium]